MEKIEFMQPDGTAVAFYVLEQTMLAGHSYILVTDTEDGDGEALILRDDSEQGDPEAVYVPVEEENEFAAVAEVFSNMLEDVDLSE